LTQTVGNLIHVEFRPALLGQVQFMLETVLNDGSVAVGRSQGEVGLPQAPPLRLRANAFVRSVHLNLGSIDAYKLRPDASFSDEAGDTPISLEDMAVFRLVGKDAATVIDLAANGTVRARSRGRALVEADFAGVSNRIEIIVD
jgi:hypothetical protein